MGVRNPSDENAKKYSKRSSLRRVKIKFGMSESNVLVSIIIPHWNGIETLSDCLTSLTKTNYKPFEIIVVDNCSTDGSQEWVSKLPKYYINRE